MDHCAQIINISILTWAAKPKPRSSCLTEICMKKRERTLQNGNVNALQLTLYRYLEHSSISTANVYYVTLNCLPLCHEITSLTPTACSLSGHVAQSVEQRWSKSEGRGFESHPDQSFFSATTIRYNMIRYDTIALWYDTIRYDPIPWLWGDRVGFVVREHFPSTNVVGVQFSPSASCVGWPCWFSSMLWEVFPWVLQFSPLIKNQHLTWLDLLNNNYCKIVIWAMLISSRFVKRIWSYIHTNLRYRNIKHHYYYYYIVIIT